MTKQVVAILGICKIITILKMYKVTDIGRKEYELHMKTNISKYIFV